MTDGIRTKLKVRDSESFNQIAIRISEDELGDRSESADRYVRNRVFHQAVIFLGGPEDLGSRHILDIGGGPATYSAWFAKLAREVTCLDLSKATLMVAKKRVRFLGVRVNLIRADAEALPFKPEAFNDVVAFASLHHIPDWRKCLREIERVTRGRMLLWEPNAASLLHLVNELLLLWRPEVKGWRFKSAWKVRETHHFTPWRLRNEIESLGLHNTKLKVIGFVPQYLPLHPSIVKTISKLGNALEKTPLLNRSAGSFLLVGEKNYRKYS